MCKRGEIQIITIDKGPIAVDACISGLVQSLNDGGVATVASCCGHGHRPGNIALKDGRELVIAANFDEARKIDALFPIDINGETKEQRTAPYQKIGESMGLSGNLHVVPSRAAVEG